MWQPFSKIFQKEVILELYSSLRLFKFDTYKLLLIYLIIFTGLIWKKKFQPHTFLTLSVDTYA